MARTTQIPAAPPAEFPIYGLDASWPGARWLDSYGDAAAAAIVLVNLTLPAGPVTRPAGCRDDKEPAHPHRVLARSADRKLPQEQMPRTRQCAHLGDPRPGHAGGVSHRAGSAGQFVGYPLAW